MKKMIVEFINLLRQAGVTVTTQEVIECLLSFEMMGFQIVCLRNIMQMTLIKSMWERPIFDSLFDLYFLDKIVPVTEAELPGMALPASTADGSGRGKAGSGGSAEDNLLFSIDGQPPAVLEELARIFAGMLQIEDGSPKEIITKLREGQVAVRWFGAVNIIERRYATGQLAEASYRKWLEQFRKLEQALERELQRKAVRKFGYQAILPLVRHANIRYKDFAELSAADLTGVEQEVAKLARKLAERPGIRLRRAKHGNVDLRRTLQEVVRTGGKPITLRYRNKFKSKVDLWLLCDVSNSVERFSRFMLQLVQAAHKRYNTVRSFVFVDQLVEVTEWFRDKDVADLLSARELREQFSCRVGLTRYDFVFQQFVGSELLSITNRAKIIILGDARNNWHPSGAKELARIAERTPSIYWLNPLPEDQWQQGDCVFEQYWGYCHQVFECRNLAQLTEVATSIL